MASISSTARMAAAGEYSAIAGAAARTTPATVLRWRGSLSATSPRILWHPGGNGMVDGDHRRPLLASYENAAAIVSAIDPGQLGCPTPCPKYDVAALIDHLVEAGYRAAALGTLTRAAGARRCSGHDQTGVPQHGGARSPFRARGAATPRRRRLGTARRLHGTGATDTG